MVELAHGRLLAMLGLQVSAILLVTPLKGLVVDGLDRDQVRPAVVEGGGGHELGSNLVALSAIELHLFQAKTSTLGLPLLVPAPARVREAKVLAATVPCNELRTPLL